MSEMHEMHELHQMRETETGQITGTMDKDYNLFRYIETCLENALRMETYRRDAERGNDTARVPSDVSARLTRCGDRSVTRPTVCGRCSQSLNAAPPL